MAKIVAGCKYCGHVFKIEEVFEGVVLPCPRCKMMIEIKKMVGTDEEGKLTFEPALDEMLDKVFDGEGAELEKTQVLPGGEAGAASTAAGLEGQGTTAAPRTSSRDVTQPYGVTRRVVAEDGEGAATAAVPSSVEVRRARHSVWEYLVVVGVIIGVLVAVVLWWRALMSKESEQKAADAVEEAYNQKRFDIVLLKAKRFLEDFPDSELRGYVEGFVERARKAETVQQEVEKIKDLMSSGDVEKAAQRLGTLDASGTPFEKEVAELRRRLKHAKEEAEDNRVLDSVELAIKRKRWRDAREVLLAFVPHTDKTLKRYERLKARVDRYDGEARKLLSQALSEHKAGNCREAMRLVRLMLKGYGDSVAAESARQLLPELEKEMFWRLRNEGKQHMEAERWREAIKAFKEALKHKPNDAELKSLLKRCEEKIGADR
ncbi:MAG: hypothetical protein DRP82_05240 [Planctomycetota bacterium]|nr:MAG: hypothetical protein DRP82_05240 [Planctomycetota bacterium]